MLSFRLLIALLLATGASAQPKSSGVAPVVLTPVVFTQVTNKNGGFAGIKNAKSVDKVDSGSLARLVAGMQAELGSASVIPTDATQAALTAITASQLKTPEGLKRLATATKAEWAVLFELTRQGSIVARVHSSSGVAIGMPMSVAKAGSLSAPKVKELCKLVAAKLISLSSVAPAAVAEPAVIEPPPLDREVENEIDREMAFEKQRKQDLRDEPRVTRAAVLLSAGTALRSQNLSGAASGHLTSLQSSPALAMGFYVMVAPLQLFDSLQGKRLSDFTVDVHFRRAFLKAKALAGEDEGQTCAITDDAVQYRGSWRIPLGNMLPSIGLGAGYTQERAVVGCDLPVASAIYRGVDVQLRVRQPLYRDVLALDLTWGPRFLLKGTTASRPDFSWSGEAWLEARPASLLFLRAGGRVFRAQLNDGKGLKVVDLRSFIAAEVGVFL